MGTKARQEPELPIFCLPRSENQDQRVKVNESKAGSQDQPRPECQGQRIKAKESRPTVMVNEPRTESQVQSKSRPENSRPRNQGQRVKTSESRPGPRNQGQRARARIEGSRTKSR